MDPSNVVANGNSNGNSNENNTSTNNNIDMDVDEGDQVDSNAAVDELLNQAEADFEPSIQLLVQMQNRFEQIQGVCLLSHNSFVCVRFYACVRYMQTSFSRGECVCDARFRSKR